MVTKIEFEKSGGSVGFSVAFLFFAAMDFGSFAAIFANL